MSDVLPEEEMTAAFRAAFIPKIPSYVQVPTDQIQFTSDASFTVPRFFPTVLPGVEYKTTSAARDAAAEVAQQLISQAVGRLAWLKK